MVAPPWYDIPPKGYGGIESMTADLVRGLLARGHRVTVIGAGDGVDRRTYNEPPSARIRKSCTLPGRSTSQRASAPDLNWVAQVHNAVDFATFPFCARKEGLRAATLRRSVMTEVYERFYQQVFARIHDPGRPAGPEG